MSWDSNIITNITKAIANNYEAKVYAPNETVWKDGAFYTALRKTSATWTPSEWAEATNKRDAPFTWIKRNDDISTYEYWNKPNLYITAGVDTYTDTISIGSATVVQDIYMCGSENSTQNVILNSINVDGKTIHGFFVINNTEKNEDLNFTNVIFDNATIMINAIALGSHVKFENCRFNNSLVYIGDKVDNNFSTYKSTFLKNCEGYNTQFYLPSMYSVPYDGVAESPLQGCNFHDCVVWLAPYGSAYSMIRADRPICYSCQFFGGYLNLKPYATSSSTYGKNYEEGILYGCNLNGVHCLNLITRYHLGIVFNYCNISNCRMELGYSSDTNEHMPIFKYCHITNNVINYGVAGTISATGALPNIVIVSNSYVVNNTFNNNVKMYNVGTSYGGYFVGTVVYMDATNSSLQDQERDIVGNTFTALVGKGNIVYYGITEFGTAIKFNSTNTYQDFVISNNFAKYLKIDLGDSPETKLLDCSNNKAVITYP